MKTTCTQPKKSTFHMHSNYFLIHNLEFEIDMDWET